LEPTIEDREGRHIYYSNKGGDGEYPYLDFDNTQGHGPEHYIGTNNMTLPNYLGLGKSLYGIYKLRVHYYADHDDNPNQTQTITWHLTVKCLRFLVNATKQAVWLEIAWHGSLSSASSSGTSDFFYHDASWSNVFVVNFREPDPESLRIPPPPQNKLPK